MDSLFPPQQLPITRGVRLALRLNERQVLEELNKAKVRVSDDAGSFCSLIDVSRKTYNTWQNQLAQPDFVTFMHMLNCSFHDNDRSAIESMLLAAFDAEGER